MDKKTEALKLALEALESLRGFHICSGISCDGVITAIREALAEQPAQPSKPWVGLTEGERKEIYRQAVYVDGAIRMTEAKLKEKNT